MLLELNAYDQSRAIAQFFKNQKDSDDDKDYESNTDEEELEHIKS